MAEDTPPPEEDVEDAPETEEQEDATEEDTDADPAGLRADLAKAVKRRDAALKRARDAETKLKAATVKPENVQDDPVAKANTRMVRTEGRALLAAQGITDREDQGTVLGLLNLSDIEVSEDGDVDVEALEEKLSSLRKILGAAKDGEKPPAKRSPKVTTRDQNGSTVTPADPDAARYQRILSGRR